ncbi:hypothetical protein NKR23_g1838 [Pleurostoma richardsiae]|uniref:Exosome complex protein n=1 Tax=Pleurostoma richardsiae TaxID=41990 RepID=A0AA38S3N7_9PEZI|nr:hypothetical protein NKR23_g1838 [Pleurostoma richardsiae]
MDVTDITPHLDRLDVDLDELEEALKPLLGNMGEVSSRLPLLDKAKLYVLATYSIESVLFSALRLNGVEAKDHAVFKELIRVRQYFDKIKKIEEPAPERDTSLDKQAAIRFLKSDLADNPEVSKKLAEQLAKERAKAAIQAAKATKGDKKRAAEDEPSPESPSIASSEPSEAEPAAAKKQKRSKKDKSKSRSKS